MPIAKVTKAARAKIAANVAWARRGSRAGSRQITIISAGSGMRNQPTLPRSVKMRVAAIKSGDSARAAVIALTSSNDIVKRETIRKQPPTMPIDRHAMRRTPPRDARRISRTAASTRATKPVGGGDDIIPRTIVRSLNGAINTPELLDAHSDAVGPAARVHHGQPHEAGAIRRYQ